MVGLFALFSTKHMLAATSDAAFPALLMVVFLSAVRALEHYFLHIRYKETTVLFVDIDPQWSDALIEIHQTLNDDWRLAVVSQTFPDRKLDLPGFIEQWDQNRLRQFIDTECDKHRKYLVVFGRNQPKSDIQNDLIRKVYGGFFTITNMNEFYEEILEKSPLFEHLVNWYSVCGIPKPRSVDLALKRLLDIFASSILLVLFAPVMLVLGIMIKRESRGPAIFSQTRLGHKGKPFTCYKMRTMVEHEDDTAKWPEFSNGHVTKFGKKLRASGFDELPQLYNVLKGDMSMVGPRPLREQLAKRHAERVPFFTVTINMKPGISGWAQIHQGKDTGDDTLLEKIRYDLYYAKHFSFLLDLLIYVRTFAQLVIGKKPGAAISQIPAQKPDASPAAKDITSGHGVKYG